MVFTTYWWWFGGWFIIVLTCFNHINWIKELDEQRAGGAHWITDPHKKSSSGKAEGLGFKIIVET